MNAGPKVRTLHQLFEEQAARTPDATALALGEQRLTYGELNARANQLAHHLRRCGAGPDSIVGLSVDRSFELLVGILGILKAGGAYLPLDPAYPKARLAFMLEDACVSLLVTQMDLAAEMPRRAAKVVCLDDWSAAGLESESLENPACTAGADNLAYVIYTSGSTGKPKGALITHFNVVRLFQSTEPWFHFCPQDVWTLFHSYAFDFSVWEIWGALLYGGRLVITPYMVSRSPEAFYELLKRERVTVLNQTPSAFRQLIRAEETAEALEALALRYVIFGGEALEMRSLKPWFDRHGDKQPQLVNMYGITETTVHVTYRPLSKEDVQSGSVIGQPIPDLQVYILDTNLKLVSPGTTGEMCVAGAGLARGYLNRPELTAERFMANPYGGEFGGRLYKTGDLARCLPNGDLEYLGRIDDQVKIRGFRIELGEIESVLCQHATVREAVVVPHEEISAEKRLVAFVIARSEPDPKSLREHLKAKLPEYMVPARFLFLERLPSTQNGKVDRAALRALLGLEFAAPAPTLPASTTGLEREILRIWTDVLKVPPAGLDDNFFDAGGDSVQLAQVHARLRQHLDRDFPITDLFAHTTIRALAAHFGSNQIKPGLLSAAQERARRQRAALSNHGSHSTHGS